MCNRLIDVYRVRAGRLKMMFLGLGLSTLLGWWWGAAPAVEFRSEIASFDISSTPFQSRAANRPLDQQFDSFAAKLDEDEATIEALRSIPGKFALWRSVKQRNSDLRTATIKKALQQIASKGLHTRAAETPSLGGGLAVYAPLIRHAGGLQPDVDKLAVHLDQISRTLATTTTLDRRLRGFLERPGAPEAIYATFVYPLYVGRFRASGLQYVLQTEPDGTALIRPNVRDAATQTIARLRPFLDPVRRATESITKNAATIVEADSLHRRLKETLTDPLSTAIIANLILRREPSVSGEELMRAMISESFKNFERSGSELRLASGIDRSRIEEGLQLMYRLRVAAKSNRARLQALQEGLAGHDPLLRDLRELLSTDLALAFRIPPEAFMPIGELFSDKTIFGSALIKDPKGGWRINPHRYSQMALALDYLDTLLRDYEAQADQLTLLSRDTINWKGATGRVRIAELAMLQAASRLIEQNSENVLNDWAGEYFTARGGSNDARQREGKRLQKVIDEQRRLKTIFDAEAPPIVVNLRSDVYSDRYVHLFRSSSYAFFRTPFARSVYFTEFKDHYAARLWGIFDWSAQVSSDSESFQKEVATYGQFLRQIAKTHEKVIIYVFQTPKWLSTSSNTRLEDGRPSYLLYSPRDYREWRRLVRRTVRFLKQNLATVDVYYEVWNEPEIYWFDSTEEYLKLYEETVTAIKAEDPKAKVGGAAVNGWDGKPKLSPKQSSLNLELIRYATKKRLPLDFISWHHFERPLSELAKAKETYIKELKRLGWKTMPEFVISEWSIPGRGSALEAMYFAEYMLALYRAEVDIQTVAVWEEFSAQPRPNYLAPWGMITQQGYEKPMFRVHEFFDRISRNSEGVAVFESADRRTKVVSSRKSDGSYELIVWEAGYSPRLEAALKFLVENGVTSRDFQKYGAMENLERAIESAQAIDARHMKAFRRAQEVYQAYGSSENFVWLEFGGAKTVEVLASKTVGVRMVARQAFTRGRYLGADLERNEVMWLHVRVD